MIESGLSGVSEDKIVLFGDTFRLADGRFERIPALSRRRVLRRYRRVSPLPEGPFESCTVAVPVAAG